MPKEKTKSLNDRHYRKSNSDRSRSLRIDFPHKIGIRYIIKCRNQHTYNRRYSQRGHQFRDWCRCHICKFVLHETTNVDFSIKILGIRYKKSC